MNSFSIYLCATLCFVVLTEAQGNKCEIELDGSFLPDPRARNRFIYCRGGEEIYGQCELGFEFDPFDRVCDFVGASSTDPCYNEPDHTFLAEPSSRFNFLFCFGGLSLVGTCENKMIFNPAEQICEADTARTTKRTTPRTTQRALTQAPVSRSPCFNRPDGTFLTDPSSRDAFFYCSGGMAINGNCPNGENFVEDGALCEKDSAVVTTRRPVVTTSRRPIVTTSRRPVVTTQQARPTAPRPPAPRPPAPRPPAPRP